MALHEIKSRKYKSGQINFYYKKWTILFSRTSEEEAVCSLFDFLQFKPGQASHAANEVTITKKTPEGGFTGVPEILVALTGT